MCPSKGLSDFWMGISLCIILTPFCRPIAKKHNDRKQYNKPDHVRVHVIFFFR